ncbi:F-box protein At4g00755-like [Silene latifolia]|uniref:F-box protein At4g00755-like n=1 Tax=Silene latifolia TaxID=37657 RepID=UPI003D777D7C
MEQPCDFVERLEKDMSIKILACLEDPCDLARVSSVSKSWRRFVIENGLCKQLCLKLCPDVSKIIDVVDLSDKLKSVAISTHEIPGCRESDHRVFSLLLRGLTSFPSGYQIAEALCASSTDRFPDEVVHNTLEEDYNFAYWSSKGTSDPAIPETLVYGLITDLCLISEIHVQPLRAFWEPGRPIYSAEAVRFSMGHRRSPHKIEIHSHLAPVHYDDDMFMWTYTSPEFPMAQEAGVQRFHLPRPVLCMGGILKIELLGKVHKNFLDGLYYICVNKVQAVGRNLGRVFDIDIQKDTGCCILSRVYGPDESVDINSTADLRS